MSIPFNVNYNVKVKLNERGLAIHRANHEPIYAAHPHLGAYQPPKLDEDGYASFHLWELMQEFGRAMGLGLEVPFDTSIILVPEKPLVPPPFDPKGPFAAGAWAAVKWVEDRRDDYIREHGRFDPETGATEFPDDGEYVGELDEIVEGLQKIAQTGAA